tara:strand:+ start:302 stop:964 length:663 start_codon:yes stop_codon:yes gene_type:complete
MLAKELISYEVPPLSFSTNGERALQLMEDFKLTEMPIVEGTSYKGLISEAAILDLESLDSPLKNLQPQLDLTSVTEFEHVYEVIGKMAGKKLSLLPVLNDNKQYLGAITLNILIEKISNLAAMKDPGGILQLEMNINDYSLSEIANIVESNGAKIISSYTITHDDSTKMDVTLKINKTDLSAIIQTFERYNYLVVASFHKSDFEDDLKRRFDAFIHYLNM